VDDGLWIRVERTNERWSCRLIEAERAYALRLRVGNRTEERLISLDFFESLGPGFRAAAINAECLEMRALAKKPIDPY